MKFLSLEPFIPSGPDLMNCKFAVLLFMGFLIVCSCSPKRNALPVFKADDQSLYETIVKLDSTFFAAYNTCNVNLDKYSAFYSDSVEFYHDQGGLSTSKKEIVEGTRANVCGKVTRQLVKGSIEVYPIKNFGAIEIGYHTFLNNTEKTDKPPHPGRFVIVWQHKNETWKITRVISLH